MLRHYCALAAAIAAALVSTVDAAQLTIDRQVRPITAEEIAGGAPLGSFVHDFYITALSDILSFSNVAVTAPLYSHPLGREHLAPSEFELNFAPALSAHSFITTPGETFIAGGSESISSGLRAYADVQNLGPTNGFHFARFTTAGAGRFSGSVAIRGDYFPIDAPFDFELPSDEAGIAGLGSAAPFTFDYDYTPPQPPANPPPPPPPTYPHSIAPVMMPVSGDPAQGLAPQTPWASVWQTTRSVTAAEVAAGAPSGAAVHEFFMTAPRDLLMVKSHRITSPLYENPNGQPNEAPRPALVALDPALSANSYITLPESTTVISGNWANRGAETVSFYHGQEDGPLNAFKFAQLTTNEDGVFLGDIGFLLINSELPFAFPLHGAAPAGGESVVGRVISYLPYETEYATVAPDLVLPAELDGFREYAEIARGQESQKGFFTALPDGPAAPSSPAGASSADRHNAAVQLAFATRGRFDEPYRLSRQIHISWPDGEGGGQSTTPKPTPPPTNPPPPPTFDIGDAAGIIRHRARPVTDAEVADGAPAGAVVNEFFVSTKVDILSVGDIVATTPVYSHPDGSPTEPMSPLFAQLAPAIGVSSFISTPGPTGMVGDWRNWSTGVNIYYDTPNLGAASDFEFAQVTTTGSGTFGGRIAMRGDVGPMYMPFLFTIRSLTDIPQSGEEFIYLLQHSSSAPVQSQIFARSPLVPSGDLGAGGGAPDEAHIPEPAGALLAAAFVLGAVVQRRRPRVPG